MASWRRAGEAWNRSEILLFFLDGGAVEILAHLLLEVGIYSEKTRQKRLLEV